MFTLELCHEKTDLKVLVIVIPKEGWTRMAAPPFFWYDTDVLEFESFDFIDHILKSHWDTDYRSVRCILHRFFIAKLVSYQKEDWWDPV